MLCVPVVVPLEIFGEVVQGQRVSGLVGASEGKVVEGFGGGHPAVVGLAEDPDGVGEEGADALFGEGVDDGGGGGEGVEELAADVLDVLVAGVVSHGVEEEPRDVGVSDVLECVGIGNLEEDREEGKDRTEDLDLVPHDAECVDGPLDAVGPAGLSGRVDGSLGEPCDEVPPDGLDFRVEWVLVEEVVDLVPGLWVHADELVDDARVVAEDADEGPRVDGDVQVVVVGGGGRVGEVEDVGEDEEPAGGLVGLGHLGECPEACLEHGLGGGKVLQGGEDE